MARPRRVEYPGAWYHVMNRGAAHRTVFPDDYLRGQFLALLKDVCEVFGVACHAYCLMTNHYHLLLQIAEANLGRAMQYLAGVYVQRHNKRLQTDGPLFRGRYKAQLIEDGEYLWCVSRYIHRNPLEAGLCRQLTQYRWSSYRCFAGCAPTPSWLHTQATTQQFGSADEYCQFVHTQPRDGEIVIA